MDLLTLVTARNCRYAAADGSVITMEAKFAELSDFVPFDASASYHDAHQIVAYVRAKSGEFGAISDYVAIPPAPDPPADQLVTYANRAQWALATGGYPTTVNGTAITFPTTEASLALISGKAQRLARPNPPANVNWQVGPTDFVTIAAADFLVLATEISDFVQATFDALPAIFAAIAAGTIKTTAGIDAALAAAVGR